MTGGGYYNIIAVIRFFRGVTEREAAAYIFSMQRTLAVVNLKNLKYNAAFVRDILGNRQFYAVVKANAYGHGAARVALALESAVNGFCVAITDEGVALRLAGITKPILVFTPPLGADDVLRAKFYGLTVTVNSTYTAKTARGLPCHIKVNTGMNRLGCNICELEKVLNEVDKSDLMGVYSHLYAPQSRSAREEQLKIFNRAEELVKAKKLNTFAHIAASGGLLAGEKYLKDGARAGILLYGYAPHGFKAEVKPVLKVYARKVQTTLFTGGGAGYAAAKKQYGSLTTYRLGYADGFFRRSPLGVSPLCMDSFIGGDEGDMRCVLNNAELLARQNGTISYEALCAATRRAEIVYEE